MCNLSKQQQSTAITRDKLGFSNIWATGKNPKYQLSPNLPFVLSHPQKGTAIYTRAKNTYLNFMVLYFKFFTYSLIPQNKFQFIKQPFYLWMFTYYIFSKTLYNPFFKLFRGFFLYPLIKYDKAEHFSMKKSLLCINSKFSLNIVYSFQRALELSIDESPRPL